MKNAREMLEHLSEFAKKTFEDGGEVLPMWVLEDPAGKKMPIIAPFNGDEEKNLAVAFVREKAKDIDAVLSGFMCEAWVVEKLTDKRDLNCQPSQHKDRREVIHIYTEDVAGKNMMGMYYILRPEHGKAKLSPFKVIEGGDFSGRFTSILERVK